MHSSTMSLCAGRPHPLASMTKVKYVVVNLWVGGKVKPISAMHLQKGLVSQLPVCNRNVAAE